MTRSIRAALCWAAFSIAALASLNAVAAPAVGTVVQDGAFVQLGQPQVNGEVTFTYGWNNSKQLPAAPAGFWIGLYDVTNSHYIWAGDYQFPVPAVGGLDWTSLRSTYSGQLNLPAGDYKVNFFVRSSYGPAINSVVIELPFTIR